MKRRLPVPFYCAERGALRSVLPILECDGMKALLGPANINTDDDGAQLVLIHTDSRARIDSRYIFFFLVAESEQREKAGTQGAGPPPARTFRMSPFSGLGDEKGSWNLSFAL
jgi:hypothetical protein